MKTRTFNAWGQECPRCGALPDHQCRTKAGRLAVTHQARLEVAVRLFKTGKP